MANALKKVQIAVQADPKDPENWILWALIMKTVGNYKSAEHKLQQALYNDPKNQTAINEWKILQGIIEMDKQVSIKQLEDY